MFGSSLDSRVRSRARALAFQEPQVEYSTAMAG